MMYVYGIVIGIAIVLVIILIRNYVVDSVTVGPSWLNAVLKKKGAGARGPVQLVNEEELRETFTPGRGGKVNWIDRKATTVSDLRTHGRLVLVGATNLGKTREAIELIRRAVEDGLVGWDSVIKPNPAIEFTNPKSLMEKSGIDPDKNILLFIDDFPYHYSGEKLERLARLVRALESCRNLYVVLTARGDQVTQEHESWFSNQRVQQIPFGMLDKEKIGRLIDNAAGVYNMHLEEAARTTLIDGWDGTPGLILWGMELLKHEGDQITADAASRIVNKSILETWQKTKLNIIKQHLCAEYLFKSLGTFYAVRVRPYTYFVLRYAYVLWNEQHPSSWRLGRIKELRDALNHLVSFEIVNIQGKINFRDFQVEGIVDVSRAGENLSEFLLSDHKLFQNPIGRWIYPRKREHAFALTDLVVYFAQQKANQAGLHIAELSNSLLPSAVSYYNLGVTLNDLNRKEEAEKMYRKAIEKDENFVSAYNNLGLVLDHLNRKEEAEGMYRKAIEKDENFAMAYCNLGIVLSHLNRNEEAEGLFRKAVEKDENDAKAYYNLGVFLSGLNRKEEAEGIYRTAIEKDENYAKAYFNLGMLMIDLNRKEEAEGLFRTAIENDENDATSYYNIACLRALAGDVQTAFEFLQQAILKGFDDKAWAWNDPDLEILRQDPRFEKIVGPKPDETKE